MVACVKGHHGGIDRTNMCNGYRYPTTLDKEVMEMKRRMGNWLFFLLILALLLLPGCRQSVSPEQVDDPDEETEVEEIQEPDMEPEEEEPVETITAQGQYVGFADARSVEIQLESGEYDYMVFQLEKDVLRQLEEAEPEPGTPVTITFQILEQGQPVITSIQME